MSIVSGLKRLDSGMGKTKVCQISPKVEKERVKEYEQLLT